MKLDDINNTYRDIYFRYVRIHKLLTKFSSLSDKSTVYSGLIQYNKMPSGEYILYYDTCIIMAITTLETFYADGRTQDNNTMFVHSQYCYLHHDDVRNKELILHKLDGDITKIDTHSTVACTDREPAEEDAFFQYNTTGMDDEEVLCIILANTLPIPEGIARVRFSYTVLLDHDKYSKMINHLRNLIEDMEYEQSGDQKTI